METSKLCTKGSSGEKKERECRDGGQTERKVQPRGRICVCSCRIDARMPTAARTANCSKTETKLSCWTPLNHPQANSKVFAERRSLLAKWFDRWSDSQRKAVLQDFVLSCSVEQLSFLSLSVSRRLPLQAADFTCLLPRALCLYIFSFLDPRSLSRCAQVSWHWRSIVELDQLWMRKCLKLGWCIHSCPTAFEQGVWKRHYIQRVQELRLSRLQVTTPAVSSRQEECVTASSVQERPASSSQTPGRRSGSGLKKEKQPPWRDADKHPKDTIRFNYLDNLDPPTEDTTGHWKSRASTCSGGRQLTEAHYKLRKAKSLMFLSSNSRPPPSPPLPPPSCVSCPLTAEASQSLLRLARCNAAVRPGPVRPPVPRLSVEALRASRRTHRSAPGTPLFPSQPWTEFASRALEKNPVLQCTAKEIHHAT